MAKSVEKTFQLDMGFGEAVTRYLRVNTKDLQVVTEDEGDKASPFVKWVGGKRSIIGELLARVPEKFGTYWEPFMGGSALFYALHSRIKKAVLSDINLDLAITYEVVKRDVEVLIKLLAKHRDRHSEEYYYGIRSQQQLSDPIELAARFIYLNKTCFNGVWRVNKSGEFNVPIGTLLTTGILQETKLRNCSKALRKATILYEDYNRIDPDKGDFVYFDPPYHPVSVTASFTGYTNGGFTEKDQRKLKDFMLTLSRKGVKVMLSNSNTEFIQKLYKNPTFRVQIVHAPRNVNCKPNKRGAVEEVLITNY